jgi:hypothetical protein
LHLFGQALGCTHLSYRGVSGALYAGGKAAGALSLQFTSLVYLFDIALRLKDNFMFKGFSYVYLKGYVDIKFRSILSNEETGLSSLFTFLS